jgi:hypothetical protein
VNSQEAKPERSYPFRLFFLKPYLVAVGYPVAGFYKVLGEFSLTTRIADCQIAFANRIFEKDIFRRQPTVDHKDISPEVFPDLFHAIIWILLSEFFDLTH